MTSALSASQFERIFLDEDSVIPAKAEIQLPHANQSLLRHWTFHLKNLARHFAQFRKLSYAEQRMMLTAAACMPIFWLCLRVMGLPRFQARIERARKPICPAITLPEIKKLGELVNIAARQLLGARTCLVRSLLLGWLLQRRGVQSQLRIGVRLTQGALAAHAWVEYRGEPVNDQADVASHFATFGELVPLTAFEAS